MVFCFIAAPKCRDPVDVSRCHLDTVSEDIEGGDEERERQDLASSTSSDELALPATSGPGSQSPSQSRSQPSKPSIPPRQRPSIPPRSRENTAAAVSSEGQLEPTPFDLPDPFQDFDRREESPAGLGKPPLAPKPKTRPPVMKKPQSSVDTSANNHHSSSSLTKVSQFLLLSPADGVQYSSCKWLCLLLNWDRFP